MFLRLIPKVFYDRLEEGLDLFVDGLGFEVLYREPTLAVVGRDGAKAYVVESPEYAAKDRPELAIEMTTSSRSIATSRLGGRTCCTRICRE